MTAHIKKGFTLIELLIVMAILGVLAVVVLIAINPAEQLARARDSGRISAVNQLGRALTAYYVANMAYPGAVAGVWDGSVVASQDLQRFPAAVAPVTTDPRCVGAEVNGYCYATNTCTDGNDYAVTFALLVSQQQQNKCTSGTPYSVFSTFDARGGIVCAVPDPCVAGNYM